MPQPKASLHCQPLVGEKLYSGVLGIEGSVHLLVEARALCVHVCVACMCVWGVCVRVVCVCVCGVMMTKH